MQDEPFQIISTDQISGKTFIKVVGFQHDQHVSENMLKISEILYKHCNHWHIRDAKLSYQHPSDYINFIRQLPPSIPVYKMFLDVYYDDFGMFIIHWKVFMYNLEICVPIKESCSKIILFLDLYHSVVILMIL